MSILDAALAYAAIGIPVFPCNAAKKPNTPNGFKDATTDSTKIKNWWRWAHPFIGMPTGKVSGISVLDLDVKNGKDGFAAFPNWQSLSNVISRTVHGAHLFFKAENAPHCTSDVIAPGVDTRGDGGYVILPPSPGYEWASDNLSLDELPDWPDDIRVPLRANGKSNEELEAYDAKLVAPAVAAIANDDLGWDDWNRIGMAIYAATSGSDEGAQLFDAFSQKSSKYKKRETTQKWKQYKRSPPTRIGMGSLWEIAFQHDSEWLDRANSEAIEHGAAIAANLNFNNIKYKIAKLDSDEVPQHLLNVDGILSKVVELYRATSAQDQPQFAVQAALALGSVAMGRRFMTDERNYSSLYFINVSESSTGKEHVKHVLEQILLAADLRKLLGPSGYWSDSAVHSALYRQPTHITIKDEFGLLLQSNKALGSHQGKINALTLLMEVFSRCDGEQRQMAYSLAGVKDKDINDDIDRRIVHPALTFIGLTTPGTLYDNLDSNHIKSGMLGRFLIVESFLERATRRRVNRNLSIDAEIISWVKECEHGIGSNLHTNDNPLIAPSPIIVNFSEASHQLLDAFHNELLAEMKLLDSARMSAMLGRTLEIAQRVALIVAVSKNESEISCETLQWAIDYVRFYAYRIVMKLRRSISDSPFEAGCKKVIEFVEARGEAGATESEIGRYPLRGMDLKQRRAIYDTLRADQRIRLCEFRTAGRTRKAWVACVDDEVTKH
jgi:hypothetical protein